jgi:hypothetical protein
MFLLSWPRKTFSYQALEEKGGEDALSRAGESTPSFWPRDTLWALLACFFASTTVVLWWLPSHGGGNYERGFDTELRLSPSPFFLVLD